MRVPINCIVPYINVFCRETPLLETLYLQNFDVEFICGIRDDDVLPDSIPSFLPLCPQLSSITMISPGEAALLPARGPGSSTSPLEKLVTLDLEGVICDPTDVWTLLSYTPNLAFLRFTQLDYCLQPPVPSTRLRLPKLRELQLDRIPYDKVNNTTVVWAPFLDLPALEKLDLGQASPEVQDAIIPRVRDTVTAVSFGNTAFEPERMPLYATMTHVREACIEEEDYGLDRIFFDLLRAGLMWPQLRALRFIRVNMTWSLHAEEEEEDDASPHDEECRAMAQAFLDFVRARNSNASGVHISHIGFENCSVDQDLFLQLKELVADVRRV
ncbi:hypothetical protein AURDEDRAFT_183837 [Auricularia subglabra TFB-10046 SS5]|nr:hypothetical protein AURDEDRAFT_183837 [Auricularia subglabra TFB-10046 SS5]